jgi:hypothetical protein
MSYCFEHGSTLGKINIYHREMLKLLIKTLPCTIIWKSYGYLIKNKDVNDHVRVRLYTTSKIKSNKTFCLLG